MLTKARKHIARPMVMVIVLSALFSPATNAYAANNLVHPEIMDLHRSLRSSFGALGIVGYRAGLRMITDGLTEAAMKFAQKDGAVNLAAQMRGGFRPLVENALKSNRKFLRSVVKYLKWLADKNIVTPQNRNALNVGKTWLRKSGAVDLSAFLRLMAVIVVAVASGYMGYQTGKAWLYEMDQTANAAEETAYADLLKLLIKKTTKGDTKLCDNMTYAEAGTRLRINLHTMPNQPFWGIVCKKVDAMAGFTGKWTCPGNGIMHLRQSGSKITGSLKGFDGGKSGYWGKYHRKGGRITDGTFYGDTVKFTVKWNDGTVSDQSFMLVGDGKDFRGSWSWFKTPAKNHVLGRGNWKGHR